MKYLWLVTALTGYIFTTYALVIDPGLNPIAAPIGGAALGVTLGWTAIKLFPDP